MSATDVPRITPEGVKDFLDAGRKVLFIDARSAGAFAKASEQIPGSLRVPPGDAAAHLEQLGKTGATLVAYCTSAAERSSASVVRLLRDAGHHEAYALLGGFDAWRDGGLPIEPLGDGHAHAPTP